MDTTARYSLTSASSISASYCSSSSSLTAGQRRWSPARRSMRRQETSRLGSAQLFDLGSLARSVPQVIELRSAHVPVGVHLDLRNGRRVDWKRPLDSHSKAHLAHREGLSHSRAL